MTTAALTLGDTVVLFDGETLTFTGRDGWQPQEGTIIAAETEIPYRKLRAAQLGPYAGRGYFRRDGDEYLVWETGSIEVYPSSAAVAELLLDQGTDLTDGIVFDFIGEEWVRAIAFRRGECILLSHAHGTQEYLEEWVRAFFLAGVREDVKVYANIPMEGAVHIPSPCLALEGIVKHFSSLTPLTQEQILELLGYKERQGISLETMVIASVALCVTTSLLWGWMWWKTGQLQFQVKRASAELKEAKLTLERERNERAGYLTAAENRPMVQELIAVIERIPPSVQVKSIVANARQWKVTGVVRGDAKPSDGALIFGKQEEGGQLWEVSVPRPAP